MLDRAQRVWFRRQADYPVRWWFTDEDFDELRACPPAMNLPRIELVKNGYRLFGLPVSIERFGQPSRLLLRDGTTIPIMQSKEQSA